MCVVLGIDAAWTATQPSGVALVRRRNRRWRVVAVAPSYDAFFALSEGGPVDWKSGRFSGSTPDTSRLLDASQRLAGASVDVVAVDMPVATVPISGRRAADNAISREFGSRGCSTHSPSVFRPGKVGRQLSEGLEQEGYPVAATDTKPGTQRRLLEVYPHPAILQLLGRDYRVPYKVSNYRKYNQGKSAPECIRSVTGELFNIMRGLEVWFGSSHIPVPEPASVKAVSRLKPFEDALDAIVCAWVGARYIMGEAQAYGDRTAAVWCPRSRTADTNPAEEV